MSDFEELARVEAEILAKRLDAMRLTDPNSADTGFAVESMTRDLFRSFLPASYGLGSGKVAWLPKGASTPSLSPQLDLIIYDAVTGGPIADFGSFAVFPLESVLGYVEVKTQLTRRKDGIDKKLDRLTGVYRTAAEVRAQHGRYAWKSWGPTNASLVELDPADTAGTQREHQHERVSIRSFLFALDWGWDGDDQATVLAAFQTATESAGGGVAELSAALVARVEECPGGLCLRNQPDGHERQIEVLDGGIARFKWEVLHALGRFPQLLPADARRLPPSCQLWSA